MKKSTVLFIVFALLISLALLSSCGEVEPNQPPEPAATTEPAVAPTETPFSEPTGYPGPQDDSQTPVEGYPGPEEPVSSTDQGYPGPGIAPGEPHSGGDGPVEPGVLYVDSVDLLLMESFPLQMMATANGSFADGCTFYDTHVQKTEGNRIEIELFALRPAEQTCTEALVPFEIQVPVDIIGLKAGDYIVEVNGSASAPFSLSQDNILTDS